MNNIKIRQADSNDIIEIDLIHISSVTSVFKYYSPLILMKWLRGTLFLRNYSILIEKAKKEYLKDMNEKTFVLEYDKILVGFGTITFSSKEIKKLFIHNSFQGKGFGSILLERLEQELINNGITEINVKSSLNAMNFYKSKGYISLDNEFITFLAPDKFYIEIVNMKKLLIK